MPTLRWLTRDEDVRAAAGVPYRLLEEDAGLGYGDPDAGNMLIQGDNLEALKALLPYYAGQVKCIYIDPPYNTGSAFEHYDDNLEHSKWLAMMWPRLELLRELLSEDGSIWVSIDDREGHYLKVIMDEVFGRENFISSIIWQKKYAPKADTKYISESHDFIISYAKRIPELSLNRIAKTEKQTSRYKNPDNDPRGPWKAGDTLRNEVRDYAVFPVKLPSGEEAWPSDGTSWRYTKDKFAELIADNRIWFGKTGGSRPAIKRFISEVTSEMPPISIWGYEDVGHNDGAKKESKKLFGGNLFGTPKPESLIERVMQIATNPGDLVLDSFLGSGTTAAVAQKMGRRYIGIEMGDHAVTHCVPRLQKVIDGEQGGISKAQEWQGGGGFRFHRLGPAVFDEEGRLQPDIRFPVLAAHIWFAETGTPLTAPANPSPYLGAQDAVGYALLYNGILGDKSVNGGNVLTRKTLAIIRDAAGDFDGPLTVYGERTALSDTTLK